MGSGAKNWVRRSPGGFDRIEARFDGVAFSPHRHDTYAIGVTLAGVQTFNYRGSARHSLPGQMVVLHPDELHDGRAGDESPFQYKTAYVAPADIQRIIGGRPLPFIKCGVCDDPRLLRVVSALLGDLSRPLDEAEAEQVMTDLASTLLLAAGDELPNAPQNLVAVQRAREFIEAHLDRGPTLTELEQVAQIDRWQLSRDFRALLGASPHRFLVFRRLERARQMIADGSGLASAAIASGFADQSHFTRQFKKTYGVTPKAWSVLHRRPRSA